MEDQIRYSLDIPADRYMKDVFLDPDFTAALHMEGLGFESFRVVDFVEAATGVLRIIEAKPRMNAPGFVQKVLGKSQSYREEGRLGEDGIWRYLILPNSAKGRIKIAGVLKAMDTDAGCSLTFSLEATARIPLVGKKIEAFILKQFADNLRKQEAFTKKWVETKSSG